jgi:type IV secretory pathway component VirB8
MQGFPERGQGPDIILGLAYDKAIRLNRVLYMLIGLLGAVVLLLALSITFMLPLKQTQPYFIPIAEVGRTHYYDIIPARKLTQSQLYELTRDYLRRYVVNRHTVDDVTEKPRFRLVKAQSADDVFAMLKKEYQTFKEKMPTVKREINVIRDIQLEPYYQQIEFQTEDTDQNTGKVFRKEWVVNIRYELAGFNAPAMKIEASEMADNPNPLGVRVVGYTWTERKDTKKEPQDVEAF